MKTMIAKYPGTCITCQKPITRGEQINFYGRGQAEHATCREGFAGGDEFEDDDCAGEDERAGLEHGTLANDRRMAKRGLSVFRFSSGAVMTQNSRGRCEDAPCCGCCS